MRSIDTNKNLLFNDLIEQVKQRKNKVTAEEWNHLWNVLSTQSNVNAQTLKELREFVAGYNQGIVQIPDGYNSMVDFVLGHTSPGVYFNDDLPAVEDRRINLVFFDIS